MNGAPFHLSSVIWPYSMPAGWQAQSTAPQNNMIKIHITELHEFPAHSLCTLFISFPAHLKLVVINWTNIPRNVIAHFLQYDELQYNYKYSTIITITNTHREWGHTYIGLHPVYSSWVNPNNVTRQLANRYTGML